MDMLDEMRKLGKKKQISFPSTPEIVARLDLAAAKLAAAEIDFAGAKLRTGHVVNAVALWLASLPDDKLMSFVRPKLMLLEEHLGRDGSDTLGEAKPGAVLNDPRLLLAREGEVVPSRPGEVDDEELSGEDRRSVPPKHRAPRSRK